MPPSGPTEAGKVAHIVTVPGDALQKLPLGRAADSRYASRANGRSSHRHLQRCRLCRPPQLIEAALPLKPPRRFSTLRGPPAVARPPAGPSRFRGVAQPGRALRSGRRCRRFKSCHPDQYFSHICLPLRATKFQSDGKQAIKMASLWFPKRVLPLKLFHF